MSTISKRSETKLRSWHFFYIEAKRTLLIQELKKIEAKLPLLNAYTRAKKDRSEAISAYSTQ
jgi:hypothetical protein